MAALQTKFLVDMFAVFNGNMIERALAASSYWTTVNERVEEKSMASTDKRSGIPQQTKSARIRTFQFH
jgi:hypothetical protein